MTSNGVYCLPNTNWFISSHFIMVSSVKLQRVSCLLLMTAMIGILFFQNCMIFNDNNHSRFSSNTGTQRPTSKTKVQTAPLKKDGIYSILLTNVAMDTNLTKLGRKSSVTSTVSNTSKVSITPGINGSLPGAGVKHRPPVISTFSSQNNTKALKSMDTFKSQGVAHTKNGTKYMNTSQSKIIVNSTQDVNSVNSFQNNNAINSTPVPISKDKSPTKIVESLTEDEKPTDQPPSQKTSSIKNTKSVYLCMFLHAGLGNIMYMFASMYGVARRRGMKLVLLSDKTLKSFFKVDGAYSSNWDVCRGSKIVKESACCRRADNIYNIPNNATVSVNGYLQSYKYFEAYKDDVRKYLTFGKDILYKADLKLEQLLSEVYPGKTGIRSNITTVGIHIRRGDYLQSDLKHFGYKVATAEYLYKAQEYIKTNHTNVTFIVCSNDIVWTKDVFRGQNNLVVAPIGSAGVDMALLSLMDHMIITVGTYSFWSGWFNSGTVIYYKDVVNPKSGLGMMFSKGNVDTYYPHWIGL